MSYIDKVSVGGTVYDVQDSKAQAAVGDLKNAINNGLSVKLESGKRLQGDGTTTTTESAYGVSDFIPCDQMSSIFLQDVYVGSSSLVYAFYKEDRTFISGQNSASGDITISTIPNNARYIRFCSRTSPNNPHFFIEYGSAVSKIYEKTVTNESNISSANSIISKILSVFSVPLVSGKFINTSGQESTDANYALSDYIPCDQKTSILFHDIHVGSSVDAYAFYKDDKTFISGQNSLSGDVVLTSIPNNAKYVRVCSKATPNTPVIAIVNYKNAQDLIDALKSETDQKLEIVEPKNTTFFKGINYFDPAKTTYYTDRYCNEQGNVVSSSNTKSISFPVDPGTTYIIYVPNSNRGIVVENTENVFDIGSTYTNIYSAGHVSTDLIQFTTGATAKYVLVYINSGSYDYDTYKNSIILNKGTYTGNITPYIGNEYLPSDAGNPIYGKQVLVFGDSITDTCNFTINSSDQTTAMSWKNPSNSYVNAGGTTINYSMWPKILKESQGFAEIRNYARSGAAYKTTNVSQGEERQNLQYQITVALNDKNNPNDVFEIDNFVPDIVIFALGTNDGTPADTFDSAMAATVYQSDGVSIDVDATISALDDTKTIASARKAFMRIKKAFPMAQIFCVLPIQRANNDTNWGTLREYLSQMAKRYGCVIIDGTAESGITREFNTWNEVGEYLKDGLHPNDKGQNLMARMILSSMRSHYVPFGVGFNPMV